MKRITFRADDALVQRARLLVKTQKTTLSATLRELLQSFVSQGQCALPFDETMRLLRHVNSGRRFSRDEMNER